MSAEALTGVGWTGRVMQILHVAASLVAVNVMFLLGTLLGLGVLGLMPASVAASAVLRRSDLLAGSAEGGVVRTFWTHYRAEFGRANLAGIPFGIAVLLLAADAAVLPQLQGPLAAALLVLTGILAAGAVVSAITTIVLLSRYDDSPAAVLRYALLLPITSVPMALSVLIVIVAWTAIVGALPVLLPLVGAAIPLAVAVRLIDRRLDRIDHAG